MIRHEAGAVGVLPLLEEHGAVQKGHFELSAGDHSDTYIAIGELLRNEALCHVLAQAMALHINDLDDIKILIGVPTGGALLAEAVGEIFRERGKNIWIPDARKTHVWNADKEMAEDGFLIAPPPEFFGASPSTVVVDDVLSTGRTVNRVFVAIGKMGISPEKNPYVVEIVTVVDRRANPGERFANLPVHALLPWPHDTKPIYTASPEECKLCKRGVPLQKHGTY